MFTPRPVIAGLLLLAPLCAQIVVVPTKKKAPPPAAATPKTSTPKAAPAVETLRYCSEFGYLRVALHPARGTNAPADLVLVDPQRRRLGVDPLRGSDFSEIPRGSYSTEAQDDQGRDGNGPKSKVLEICSPQTGYYQLQVIGRASGEYELDVQASNKEVLDSAGRPMMLDSRVDQPSASIRRGVTQNFTLYFSRTPGVRVRLRAVK